MVLARTRIPCSTYRLQFHRGFTFADATAVVPGNAFGRGGEGFVRCAYATSMDNIKEAMARLVDTLEAGPDLVFSVGTSSLFPYIAEPVVWARQQGIPTVEINPGRTPLSPLVHFQIPQGAADAEHHTIEERELLSSGFHTMK